MAAIDVLKNGMNTEIWGMRFYEQASQRTESEDGKRVFESLIEEEKKHLDILRGQYASVTDSEKWVSVEDAIAMAESVDPTDIFPEASSAEDLIPADASDEKALQLAMDFERRGYDLYVQAQEEATSQEEEDMWAYLAQAEDKHFEFLQDEYDYLVNNGTWFFDEQELPFFEG